MTKLHESLAGGGRIAPPVVYRDVPFAELPVGESRTTRFHLDPRAVALHLAVAGSRDRSSAIGAPVPSAVYNSFLPLFRALGGRMEQGTVHTHQSVTLHPPAAAVGDDLHVDVTVQSAVADGRRRSVVVRTVFRLEDRAVCTTVSRYLWGYFAPRGADA